MSLSIWEAHLQVRAPSPEGSYVSTWNPNNPNMGGTEAEPLAKRDTQDLNLNPDALPLQTQG